jgi:hypothetical protein
MNTGRKKDNIWKYFIEVPFTNVMGYHVWPNHV